MSDLLVEVLIPTFNEAQHIADAVVNALQLGPVLVLDSYSTDGTQELARKAGALVVEHPFVNYSAQKNWGLNNLPFQGKWIFILDADERITPPLRDEIRNTLAANPDVAGYYINRQIIFMGRIIRHGGLDSSWNLRLFRRGQARYENRSVHEHMICTGHTTYLRSPMIHIRRETISQYLAKHIRYAEMESDEWVKWRTGENRDLPSEALFKNMLHFRQWLRRYAWPFVPGRPWWRFIYMYFVRFGFFDGRAGWHLARLMASYECMISLLYREKLKSTRKTASIKKVA